MDIDIFQERSYRRIIKMIVERMAKDIEGMNFSKLAQQTRIQRTFMSQVMNLKHHFSNDQLYAVCRALRLESETRQYIMLLSEWERCKLEARKKDLEGRLSYLEGHLLQRAPSDRTGSGHTDALDDYFCDPLGEVVLKFLSMEKFRKNPELIKERLGANSQRWQSILDALEGSGFISIDDQGIQVLRSPAYPKEQSAAEKIRNIQGRLKVANQKLKQRNIDEFIYNWWFVSNPQSKKQLKIEYLRLIEDIYRRSLQTAHENVYQLTIDLLKP